MSFSYSYSVHTECIILGIAFEAYSPLGNPGRVQKGENEPNLMDDPVVKELADKHKCTTAQVRVMCHVLVW